ncbi:unnamed protein product [Coffea canephora]|uniref:Uncharacterized protein n=1 Tax=Coffea canephora TaxID=49390 RepID=A0A068V1U7_COFCA|nr:unnamed protein product [Coffea canephora]
MEKGVDANILLDYIEFQIFPSQNRYEACVCRGKKIETVTSAILEPLLLHSATIKALHSEGFDAKYKLIAPEDRNSSRWFRKSTLMRFLQVIGSSEVTYATDAVKDEISQLEEARKFHLSLYSKGPQNHLETGNAGNSSNNNASIPKAGISSPSSDDSKNELLRAIDMRLSALRGELATAFAQSARATCSNEEMDDLEKFSHHFGATDLRDSLCKLLELNEENSRDEIPSDSQRHRINNKQENNKNCNQPQSDTPVKYSASPAKAAQIERESSSESGELSCSGDEEQPSVQRSRTLIRPASPRRSASPMRRVQIGRSGSRRSTALTIKSLNYLPRERLSCQKDAATESSDEEASEQPSKRSESNVNRISVQDAISLFESKQRDQTVDIQKTKSLLNVKVGANKSVLRRWSAGAGENFSEDPQSTNSDNAVALPSDGVENTGIANELPEEKAEHDLPSEDDAVRPAEVGIKPDSPERGLPDAACIQENAVCSQTAEISENLMDSAEWSRQKEAELNQLLMKMMETKPVKYRTGAPANRKSQNLPSEQRGGFYDHYKEKRNEKLRGETAGKRAEKEKQFRVMQQILDERKAEMASANGSDAGRKHNVKPQKSQKTSSPANHKKEISKPSVVKKASPKASPLPATRKSWPTTASPRPTGVSPAKTPPGTTSAGTTTRRKSQPAPPVPRLSPKVERSQLKPKSVKPNQNDTNKGVKDANEKQQALKKITKSAKPKLQSMDRDAASSAKPSFYNKVTKKSSVVPIESKPFLRKNSGIGSGVSPVSRAKVPPPPEDTLIVTGDANQAEENEIASSSSDQVIEQQEVNLEVNKDHADMEFNIQVNQEKYQEMETPVEVAFTELDGFQNLTDADAALNAQATEESDIPPTAWVEIEEHEEQPAPFSGNVCQIQSPSSVAPVGIPSPRVRHSLSQMLLEESSEPDVVEWGNAENPPAMVYQRDVPKGLKRLLKFARKSKTDTNSTGCSSPSVFSEGEDDTDESKFVTKRSSDNLLKKATLHAKNLGLQNTSSRDKSLAAHGTHARANISKTIGHRLSEKLQEGHISAPVTSSKATRSFFSLSAFKGGKQNEVKFL